MESLNGVNAITIVFAALCIFAIAYRFYGLWVAQKVLNINAARETPANRFEDGKDRIGQVVVTGATLDDCFRRLDEIQSRIVLDYAD